MSSSLILQGIYLRFPDRIILDSFRLKAFSDDNLTPSLLMTTQEAFEDSVDQDQTAQNVQSDL